MDEDLKRAIEMCRDNDTLPDVINSNYGIDITFSDDKGKQYTSVLRCKRRLYVDISSYIGMSAGAIHFYAKIWFSDPDLTEHETGRTLMIGGSFNRFKPDECKGKSIEVVRLVTELEMKADPGRWKCYRAGDRTDAFEDKAELKSCIDFIIKHRFTGDWEVVYA